MKRGLFDIFVTKPLRLLAHLILRRNLGLDLGEERLQGALLKRLR